MDYPDHTPYGICTCDACEKNQLRQRVAELEKERDALLEANRIACEDLVERHDRIAELKQQRDELLAAAEAIEINAEECLDFDEFTAMLVPIDTYHKLMEAITSIKDGTNVQD